MKHSRRTRILRWNEDAEPVDVTDELAVEEPLEIRIGGEPISVTMRTPGEDIELVAGMLLTESLIAPGIRPLIRQEHPNMVNVAISGLACGMADLEKVRRTWVTSTSCGLCGKASIESVHQQFPPVEDDVTIPRDLLPQLVCHLESAQTAFARTGGVHAAAVFDARAKLVVAREDVGRHNAVDKVIGNALLRGLLPLTGHILLVSGRASFEIVQKALGARIPIVAAVSAPSSLSVELASTGGQTLIGFLRADRCNVYTHAERITPGRSDVT
jgi:FdhD protein